MKTNIRHGRMTWRLGRIALIAGFVVGLLAVIGGYKPASAQGLDSFKLVTSATVFHFKVNGTNVFDTPTANVNNLLTNSGNNSLEVGWKPPDNQGEAIVFQYTGTSGNNAFGVTLNAGDLLKVYAIGGSFLTNEKGFSPDPTGNGMSSQKWDGTSGNLSWTFDSHDTGGPNGFVDYFGYSGTSTFSSPLTDTLAYMDHGTLGSGSNAKDFTGAKAFGTFNFGSIGLKNSSFGTYLGLDVLADVTDSNGNMKGTLQTGRIRVTDFDTTPEGSSLLLLACGLVPLVGIKRFIRRRTSA